MRAAGLQPSRDACAVGEWPAHPSPVMAGQEYAAHLGAAHPGRQTLQLQDLRNGEDIFTLHKHPLDENGGLPLKRVATGFEAGAEKATN